jgi:hypothetical protein
MSTTKVYFPDEVLYKISYPVLVDIYGIDTDTALAIYHNNKCVNTSDLRATILATFIQHICNNWSYYNAQYKTA